MSEVLDRRLSEFSKGMKQKLALIRTMLHDPEVLLLDEPTSAMDPQSARLVHDALVQLRDQHRRSIVLCTHNLVEAEMMADHIAIIRRGRDRGRRIARGVESAVAGQAVDGSALCRSR